MLGFGPVSAQPVSSIKLSAPAPTGVPVLSLATLVNITPTTATPRVTVTFS
jgi:hypothetical protein